MHGGHQDHTQTAAAANAAYQLSEPLQLDNKKDVSHACLL